MDAHTRDVAQAAARRRTLQVLFAVVVVDLIGFGIVIPILPFYADEIGASGAVLGGLLAVHAALQFAFAPIWGRLSDRIGRRPVMLLTISGTGVALVWLGLADSIASLFAARALSGVFAANISVATAYVADVTDESERTRYMGMIGASFGIGFLLGPALGGWLAPYGHGVPAFAAAGLAGVNTLFGVIFLREPERHARTESRLGSLREIARDAVIGPLCAVNFLFTLGVTQLESVFAYFAIGRFGADARDVAWILVAMALVMGGLQGGAMRPLVRRFGERALLLAGLAAMALSFPGVPAMPTMAWLLVPLLLAAVGRAIAQPPLLSLVSLRSVAADRGRVMGAFQSSASLARVIGPIAAGLLYDFDVAAPFYLASVCLACAGFVALRTVATPVARPIG